jgi:acyl carrier protein
MTKLELLEEIKETLQRDKEISFDMKLEDIEEWDSLASISMISLYDQLFEFLITFDKLEKCKTFSDLVELVSDKLDS